MTFTDSDLRKIAFYHVVICLLFEENSDRKNLFIAICLRLNTNIDLHEISEECPYGGLVGSGNSKLELVLGRFRLFQIHAAFHDACGFMKAKYNVGPGYCYAFPCSINSCFLGHISGMIYCLYLKIFKPKFWDILI